MRHKWLVNLLVRSLCVAMAIATTQASAQQPPDPDWPCIQVLVPAVSAATIWDGPAIDKLAQDWQQVPQVAQLVKRLTAPRVDRQASETAIEGFAAALQPPQRNQMLTLLFAGVLETLNQDRAKLIDGIKRFARDQAARASRLDRDLTELLQLEEVSGDAALQQHRRLQNKIQVEQRVFDERERAIEYLCGRPVAVEQRLGALARSISMQLD